jgi:hypothetical protein
MCMTAVRLGNTVHVNGTSAVLLTIMKSGQLDARHQTASRPCCLVSQTLRSLKLTAVGDRRPRDRCGIQRGQEGVLQRH